MGVFKFLHTSVMSTLYCRIVFIALVLKPTAMIKYKVTLTKDERDQLMDIVNKGSHSSQQFRSAYILLNCDDGKYGDRLTGTEICRVLKISMRMVDRVKQRFVEDGFDACIERKPMTSTKPPKIDGTKKPI